MQRAFASQPPLFLRQGFFSVMNENDFKSISKLTCLLLSKLSSKLLHQLQASKSNLYEIIILNQIQQLYNPHIQVHNHFNSFKEAKFDFHLPKHITPSP